jgi:hypothetical protein
MLPTVPNSIGGIIELDFRYFFKFLIRIFELEIKKLFLGWIGENQDYLSVIFK